MKECPWWGTVRNGKESHCQPFAFLCWQYTVAPYSRLKHCHHLLQGKTRSTGEKLLINSRRTHTLVQRNCLALSQRKLTPSYSSEEYLYLDWSFVRRSLGTPQKRGVTRVYLILKLFTLFPNKTTLSRMNLRNLAGGGNRPAPIHPDKTCTLRSLTSLTGGHSQPPQRHPGLCTLILGVVNQPPSRLQHQSPSVKRPSPVDR